MRVAADCRREAFGRGDAAVLLALFLLSEAGVEAVRTREALAAVVANQVMRMQVQRETAGSAPTDEPVAALFVECLNRLGRAPSRRPCADDAVYASCLRIAKRAVRGALHDPTGGAIRFHRLGCGPVWASEQSPGLLIGPFLFYGEPPPAPPASLCRHADHRQFPTRERKSARI